MEPSGSGADLQIHVAKDTDSGVQALCGRVNTMVVYPKELGHYSYDSICSECMRLTSLRISQHDAEISTAATESDPARTFFFKMNS